MRFKVITEKVDFTWNIPINLKLPVIISTSSIPEYNEEIPSSLVNSTTYGSCFTLT